MPLFHRYQIGMDCLFCPSQNRFPLSAISFTLSAAAIHFLIVSFFGLQPQVHRSPSKFKVRCMSAQYVKMSLLCVKLSLLC